MTKADWDVTQNTFTFLPGALPVPFFPIEGILTRQLDGGTASGGYPLRFIETSSPGLRGQSGGANTDVDGTVWAMQSRTQSYSNSAGERKRATESSKSTSIRSSTVAWAYTRRLSKRFCSATVSA